MVKNVDCAGNCAGLRNVLTNKKVLVEPSLQNIVFLRFSGKRGKTEASKECESHAMGGVQKKITPVHQTLFMLFRHQTHPQTTNQL